MSDKRFEFTTELTVKQGLVFIIGLLIMFIIFYVNVEAKNNDNVPTQIITIEIVTEIETITTEVITTEESITTEAKESFKYYQIPEEYAREGGELTEEVQRYIWSLCEDRGIDYYILLALIERESGYKHNALGDKGNSKGYMQIWESWHIERMEEEEATDLTNPYDNVRVGVNFLVELYAKYEDWSKTLMAYNMGESVAKRLWNDGTYSTAYSRGIMKRAQEIEQEIKQD